MEKEFTLKKYNTIDELYYASFSAECPDMDFEEFKKLEFGGLDADQNEVPLSYESQIEGIKNMGYWGWVDEQNVIHYWVGKKVPIEELIHFMAHEIGHRIGIPIQDDFQEEMRAEGYGEAATLAYKFAKQVSEIN